LLLAACWLQWSWRANAALDLELSLIRMRCQSVSESEIVSVERDDAAAALFFQAIDAYQPSGRGYSRDDLPKSPAWLASAQQQMFTQNRSLDLVRTARNASSAIAAATRPDDPSQVRGFRALSLFCLLNDLALYSHQAGDDAAAVQYLLDSEAFFRFIYTTPAPSEVPHLNQLYALRSCGTIPARVRVIAVRLVSASSATTRPADPQQVRLLIKQLLDTPVLLVGYHKSIVLVRSAQLDRLTAEPAGWCLLRPYSSTLTADVLGRYRSADQYLLQQYAKPLYDPLRGNAELPAAEIFSSALGQYGQRYRDADMKEGAFEVLAVLADRRIAAVSLAFRLFIFDHGHYPAALDELVPEYLPEIPRDPFSPDRGPFRYALVNGGKRPILYYSGQITIRPNQLRLPPVPSFIFNGNWPVIDLDDVPPTAIPAK